MPQIQILPPQETGAGLIFRSLGEGLSRGIQSSMEEYRERKKQEEESTLVQTALKDLSPDASEYEVANKIIGLPIRPESKKLYGTLTALAHSARRENRLQAQSVTDQYRKSISDINNELKEVTSEGDKKRLLTQRDRLKKELAQNHKRMRQGLPPAFDAFEDIDFDQGEDEENDFQEMPMKKKPSILPGKPKRKLTEQVVRHFMEKSGGDVNRAKKMAFEQGFE